MDHLLSRTIAAVNGADKLDDLHPVLQKPYLSIIIAASHHAAPAIRTVAALAADCPALLDDDDIDNPHVHAAMQRLIAIDAGADVLHPWMRIVSSGWGTRIADLLIGAVERGSCAPGVAAALIGPGDASASLLHTPGDVACAIQAWGRSRPHTPTWWITHHRSESACIGLVSLLRHDPEAFASTLPWLPPEIVGDCEVPAGAIANALTSFAQASTVARSLQRSTIRQLIARASPSDIPSLTRFAQAADALAPAAWARIGELLPQDLDHARGVVGEAPWDSIPQSVRTIMLAGAEQSNVCAAIALARGAIPSTHPIAIRASTAAAFFAALDPRRWNEMEESDRRAWLHALEGSDVHHAVRSLGANPNIVAYAVSVTNHLIAAIRSHTPDAAACRTLIFPLALRQLSITEAHTLIAGMTHMPTDPGLWMVLVGRPAAPTPMSDACPPTSPLDLADITTAYRSIHLSLPDRCQALSTVLRGRTWDDVRRIASMLDDRARAYLFPDPKDILLNTVLKRNRDHAMMSRALSEMMSLPPEIGVPALHTLAQMTRTSDGDRRSEAAMTLMETLRAHGAILVTVVDVVRGAVRRRLLPLPSHQRLANALRRLACINPLVAHRLAHALKEQRLGEAAACLRDAPPDAATEVALAAPDSVRSSICTAMMQFLPPLAAEGRAESLTALWRYLVQSHPGCAFSIIALGSDNPDNRRRSIEILVAVPDVVRLILPMMRDDIQKEMLRHPFASLMVADTMTGTRLPSFTQKRPRTPSA